MKTYKKLEEMFRADQFRKIDKEPNAKKFYYLRSISRSSDVKNFCDINNLSDSVKTMNNKEKLEFIFSNKEITEQKIEKYIVKVSNEQLKERNISSSGIVRELNKVQEFDWGGSFGNSLEANIVNNYVKKIASFSKLNNKIDNELFSSMRGYTINSWYNHWSSILIEDIFKSNPNILPTIGLIKKIDFFIKGTPYDLKVTYFPEGLMKDKLKEKEFGNELTKVKQKCKELCIPIDTSLPDKALNIQLQNALSESINPKAEAFLENLNTLKKEIIDEAMTNPDELIQWLYANQGERRFDATNRFFLILIDKTNMFNSWKLKRNFDLLSQGINNKINQFITEGPRNLEFHWDLTDKDYQVKAGILFITK